MSALKFTSRMLSFGLLSAVLFVSTVAAPAPALAAADRNSWHNSYRSSSYSRGFRDGYRTGFSDGRLDAIRRSRRMRALSMRRHSSPSPYDRGFMAAYERGYRSGFASVRRSRRHDWDDRRDNWRDRHDHDDDDH